MSPFQVLSLYLVTLSLDAGTLNIRFKNTEDASRPSLGGKPKITIQLSNIKRPEGPQKTTKVHNDRIISTVKKNSFMTFSCEDSRGGRRITVKVYN